MRIRCEQDLIPEKIVGLPLIRGSQKVIVFAGGFGDWAHCLATENFKVVYTDISPNVVEFVRKKYRHSFIASEEADAMQIPHGNIDSILFSFEPTPLYNGPFIFFMMRALALSSGIMLVQRPYIYPSPWKEIRLLGKAYNVKSDILLRRFSCRRPSEDKFREYYLKVCILTADEKTKELLLHDYNTTINALRVNESTQEIRKALDNYHFDQDSDDSIPSIIPTAARIAQTSIPGNSTSNQPDQMFRLSNSNQLRV